MDSFPGTAANFVAVAVAIAVAIAVVARGMCQRRSDPLPPGLS